MTACLRRGARLRNSTLNPLTHVAAAQVDGKVDRLADAVTTVEARHRRRE